MSEGKLTRLPEVLFEIGKAIGSDEGIGSLLGHISERICELIGADTCSIMLLDGARQRLLTRAAYGLPIADLTRISFQVGEGVAGWVVEHGRPALIPDVEQDERFARREPSHLIRAMACVPLTARGAPVGALTATSTRPGQFAPSDVELLSFIAKTIALDVENIRLRKLSVTDPLTGAYNREFLQERLPLELDAAAARGLPLSVAMVDIDHFKAINDHHGHEVGDRVLAQVAELLRGAIRSGDTLIRYGGEEFLVLLPNADVERAREVAERMRSRLEGSALRIGEIGIEVRISAGVAQHRGAVEPATTLIRRADTALYSAKGHGRNRVEAAP